MELLLFFLTLLAVIFICRAVKLNSFLVCWFTGFSYIAIQNAEKNKSVETSVITALTVILVALIVLPAAKEILTRRNAKYYELLFAVGIQVLIALLIFTEEKLLKFL